MTASLLAGELNTLVQDTRRKAPEIRTAAEKSLADLKSLSNTSEAQLAADLRRRPEFVRPFLLACRSNNPKFATSAVVSLQRLVAADGLAQERLEDLLESLRECSSLGTDVQLRVLQVMPSLFQRYGDQISESRLATALQVCFVLQAAKNAMISHTAAATLQQIINDVFTRVGTDKALADVASPDTTKASWQAELDCHQVLQDLCSIAEGKSVESLRKANVSKDFALELVGTVLLNFTTVIPRYSNFVDILRQQLLPLMLRVVSSGSSFPQIVRVLRLVPPVVQGFLEVLPTELEMLLSMLTHMLEPDVTTAWKRTMCMEALRDVYKEPSNVRRMYAVFDQEAGHKAIVQEQLAMIGRLATERPSLIGLGHASSMPTVTEQNDEDFDGLAALQADPTTATTGVSLTSTTAMDSGISVAHSSVRVSLIEQLDKADAPGVPPSYIYALVLSSLNLLCDGLAKFVLPFASSRVARSHQKDGPGEGSDESSDDERSQLPTNPLDLKDHPDGKQIQAAAGLLESCWPAILSTYSTFFQAALDAEYYHTTIRSFQKLVQVATLLRSATARDAFLTALAKQSLPGESPRTTQPDASAGDRRGSVSSAPIPRLSPRNLLCLRALLNLGIALGAVLDEAWSIVLATLQQADIIVGHISTDRTLSKGGPASIAPTLSMSGDLSKEFSSEIAAVRSAATRMLGSASDLPQKQYLGFLKLVDGLLRGCPSESSKTPQPGHHRRASSSFSSKRTDGLQDLRANVFVIDVFSQLIDYSKSRLSISGPESSGWKSIIKTLTRLVTAFNIDPEVRFAAADTICKSVIATTFAKTANERPESLIPFGFGTLRQIVDVVRKNDDQISDSTSKTGNAEIHNAALQTLKSCLDQYGESIEDGWTDACELMLSAFGPEDVEHNDKESSLQIQPYSQKLLRSAFASLQVICGDLIESLPHKCLPKVLRMVHICCSQTMDLNISLTSTSLYQTLSDNIWTEQEHLDLAPEPGDPKSPRATLWLQLLSAIAEGTANAQAEVRNNAVHACFRIFSSIGDKLLPDHWAVCMEDVILHLYRLNISARPLSKDLTSVNTSILALDETVAAIHTGTCALLQEYHSTFLKASAHESVWANWIAQLDLLLSRQSLSLTTVIYSGLSEVLEGLNNDDPSFVASTPPTWKILQDHKAYQHQRLDRPTSSDNQAALVAYASCATELYRVSLPAQRTQVAPHLLRQIADSVSESTPTTYAGDLITTTPLQADCVKLLNYVYAATATSITPAFLLILAELVDLSHVKERPNDTVKGPTFVAITKDIARLIEQFVRERGPALNLHEERGMIECLESLNVLIRHKKAWQREDQVIQVWKQATTSALNVLSPLLTLSLERESSETSTGIWGVGLQILDAILGLGDESESSSLNLSEDLLFDIDSFNRFYHLLVPSLGTDARPGSPSHCSEFAKVLLLKSIIHDPHPDDSLIPTRPSVWPNPNRIGRVRDLDPSHRSKLCYLLVDRLFEIVTQAGRSPEHSKLASAAAPYLRLRFELVLKAYITDQPLRGRMPCPLSQKKELIYLLQKSISMDQMPEITNEARKLSQEHRQSATGLAIMALRVTKRDEKIKEALLQFVEASTSQIVP